MKKRRFLLKRMPIFNLGSPRIISQCYAGVKQYIGEDFGGKTSYHSILNGISEIISTEEFVREYQKSENRLDKQKYFGEGWVVNKFIFLDLVIAETDKDIEVPEWINDALIMEVSGMEEFLDYNLADNFNKQ